MNHRELLFGVGATTLAALAAAESCEAATPDPPLEDPTDFVVRQFSEADVVLLVEDHGVSQNLAFLKSLISALHHASVGSITMVFGGASELDRIVTGTMLRGAAPKRRRTS